MDVEFAADDGRKWVDVTIHRPAAGDDSAVRAASRKPGEASRQAERTKHERYPGPQLAPFAVEVGGRLGAEARAFLLSEVRQLPRDMQTRELQRAYKAVSCALQVELARQLRKAAGVK